MIRALAGLLVASLAGCSAIEVTQLQLLPVVNPLTYDASCCVAYVEIPPSTQISFSVIHSGSAGTKVKAGAHWRF